MEFYFKIEWNLKFSVLNSSSHSVTPIQLAAYNDNQKIVELLKTQEEVKYDDNPKIVKKIKIPSSKKFIKEGEYYGFVVSKKIDFEFPSSVEFIDKLAFSLCSSLTCIVFPSSLISINEGAFRFCGSLKLIKFEFPSNLKLIDEEAFNGCSSLEKITFPLSLTEIKSRAFAYCTSLKIVENLTPNIKVERNSFENCPQLNQ